MLMLRRRMRLCFSAQRLQQRRLTWSMRESGGLERRLEKSSDWWS